MHARRRNFSAVIFTISVLSLLALIASPAHIRAQDAPDASCMVSEKNGCGAAYKGSNYLDANCQAPKIGTTPTRDGLIGKKCTENGITGKCEAVGKCKGETENKTGEKLQEKDVTKSQAESESERLRQISEQAKKLLDSGKTPLGGTAPDPFFAPREQPVIEQSILDLYGVPADPAALERLSQMGPDTLDDAALRVDRPIFSPTGGMAEDTIQQLRDMSGRGAPGTIDSYSVERAALWTPALYTAQGTFPEITSEADTSTFWSRSLETFDGYATAFNERVTQITDGLFTSEGGSSEFLTRGMQVEYPGTDLARIDADAAFLRDSIAPEEPRYVSTPEGGEYIIHPGGRVEEVTRGAGEDEAPTTERGKAIGEAKARADLEWARAETARERAVEAERRIADAIDQTMPGGGLDPFGDGLARFCVGGDAEDGCRGGRLMTRAEYVGAIEEQQRRLEEDRRVIQERLREIDSRKQYQLKDGTVISGAEFRRRLESGLASTNDYLKRVNASLAEAQALPEDVRVTLAPIGNDPPQTLSLTQYRALLRDDLARVSDQERVLSGYITDVQARRVALEGLQGAELEAVQRHERRLIAEPGYAATHDLALARAMDDVSRARGHLGFLDSDFETTAEQYRTAQEQLARAEAIRGSIERGSMLGTDAARIEARRLETEASQLARSITPDMSVAEREAILARASLAQHNAEMYRAEIERQDRSFEIMMRQYSIADRIDLLRDQMLQRSFLPEPTLAQRWGLTTEDPAIVARRTALDGEITRLRDEISLNMRPIARLAALQNQQEFLFGEQTFTWDPARISTLSDRILLTQQQFSAIAGGEQLSSYREVDALIALSSERARVMANYQYDSDLYQQRLETRGYGYAETTKAPHLAAHIRDLATIDDSIRRISTGELNDAMLNPENNDIITRSLGGWRDGVDAWRNGIAASFSACNGVLAPECYAWRGVQYISGSIAHNALDFGARVSGITAEAIGYGTAGVSYEEKVANLSRSGFQQGAIAVGQGALVALDASLTGSLARGGISLARATIAPFTLEGRALTAVATELELRAAAVAAPELAPRIAGVVADADTALARAGLTRAEPYIVRADGRIVGYIDDAGRTIAPVTDDVARTITVADDLGRGVPVVEDVARAPIVVRADPRTPMYASPALDGTGYVAVRGVTGVERTALGELAREQRILSEVTALRGAAVPDIPAITAAAARQEAATAARSVAFENAGLLRSPTAIVRSDGTVIARLESGRVVQTLPNASRPLTNAGIALEPASYRPTILPQRPAIAGVPPVSAPAPVITPARFTGLSSVEQGSLAQARLAGTADNVVGFSAPKAIPSAPPPRPSLTSSPALPPRAPSVFGEDVASLASKPEVRGAQVIALRNADTTIDAARVAARISERNALVAERLASARQATINAEIEGLRADLVAARISGASEQVSAIEARILSAQERRAAVAQEAAVPRSAEIIGFAPRPRPGGTSGLGGSAGIPRAPESGSFAAVRSSAPPIQVPSSGPTALLRGANQNPVRTLVQEGNVVRVVEEAAPAVSVPRTAARPFESISGSGNPRAIPAAANDNMRTLVAANDNAPVIRMVPANDNTPLRAAPILPSRAQAPPLSVHSAGLLSPVLHATGENAGEANVFNIRPVDFTTTALALPEFRTLFSANTSVPLSALRANPLPQLALAEPRLTTPYSIDTGSEIPSVPRGSGRAPLTDRFPLPVPGIRFEPVRGATALPALPTLGGIASNARPAAPVPVALAPAALAPVRAVSGRDRPLIPGDTGYVAPTYAPGYPPGVAPLTDDPGGDLRRAYEAEQRRIADEQRRRFFESQVEWALQRLRTLNPSEAARYEREFTDLSSLATSDALFRELGALLARIQQATLNGGALAGGAGGDSGTQSASSRPEASDDEIRRNAQIARARVRFSDALDALRAPIPEAAQVIAAANPSDPVEMLVRERQRDELRRATSALEQLGLSQETAGVRASLSAWERSRINAAVSGFAPAAEQLMTMRFLAGAPLGAREALIPDTPTQPTARERVRTLAEDIVELIEVRAGTDHPDYAKARRVATADPQISASELVSELLTVSAAFKPFVYAGLEALRQGRAFAPAPRAVGAGVPEPVASPSGRDVESSVVTLTWEQREQAIASGASIDEANRLFFGNAATDMRADFAYMRELERLGALHPTETAAQLISRSVDALFEKIVDPERNVPYLASTVEAAGRRVTEAQAKELTAESRLLADELNAEGLPIAPDRLELALYVRYGGLVHRGPVAEAIIAFVDKYVAEGYSPVFSGVRIIPRDPQLLPNLGTQLRVTRPYPVSGDKFAVALEVGAVPFHLSHGGMRPLTGMPAIVSDGMRNERSTRTVDVPSRIELERNFDSSRSADMPLQEILAEVLRSIRRAERASEKYAAAIRGSAPRQKIPPVSEWSESEMGVALDRLTVAGATRGISFDLRQGPSPLESVKIDPSALPEDEFGSIVQSDIDWLPGLPVPPFYQRQALLNSRRELAEDQLQKAVAEAIKWKSLPRIVDNASPGSRDELRDFLEEYEPAAYALIEANQLRANYGSLLRSEISRLAAMYREADSIYSDTLRELSRAASFPAARAAWDALTVSQKEQYAARLTGIADALLAFVQDPPVVAARIPEIISRLPENPARPERLLLDPPQDFATAESLVAAIEIMRLRADGNPESRNLLESIVADAHAVRDALTPSRIVLSGTAELVPVDDIRWLVGESVKVTLTSQGGLQVTALTDTSISGYLPKGSVVTDTGTRYDVSLRTTVDIPAGTTWVLPAQARLVHGMQIALPLSTESGSILEAAPTIFFPKEMPITLPQGSILSAGAQKEIWNVAQEKGEAVVEALYQIESIDPGLVSSSLAQASARRSESASDGAPQRLPSDAAGTPPFITLATTELVAREIRAVASELDRLAGRETGVIDIDAPEIASIFTAIMDERFDDAIAFSPVIEELRRRIAVVRAGEMPDAARATLELADGRLARVMSALPDIAGKSLDESMRLIDDLTAAGTDLERAAAGIVGEEFRPLSGPSQALPRVLSRETPGEQATIRESFYVRLLSELNRIEGFGRPESPISVQRFGEIVLSAYGPQAQADGRVPEVVGPEGSMVPRVSDRAYVYDARSETYTPYPIVTQGFVRSFLATLRERTPAVETSAVPSGVAAPAAARSTRAELDAASLKDILSSIDRDEQLSVRARIGSMEAGVEEIEARLAGIDAAIPDAPPQSVPLLEEVLGLGEAAVIAHAEAIAALRTGDSFTAEARIDGAVAARELFDARAKAAEAAVATGLERERRIFALSELVNEMRDALSQMPPGVATIVESVMRQFDAAIRASVAGDDDLAQQLIANAIGDNSGTLDDARNLVAEIIASARESRTAERSPEFRFEDRLSNLSEIPVVTSGSVSLPGRTESDGSVVWYRNPSPKDPPVALTSDMPVRDETPPVETPGFLGYTRDGQVGWVTGGVLYTDLSQTILRDAPARIDTTITMYREDEVSPAAFLVPVMNALVPVRSTPALPDIYRGTILLPMADSRALAGVSIIDADFSEVVSVAESVSTRLIPAALHTPYLLTLDLIASLSPVPETDEPQTHRGGISDMLSVLAEDARLAAYIGSLRDLTPARVVAETPDSLVVTGDPALLSLPSWLGAENAARLQGVISATDAAAVRPRLVERLATLSGTESSLPSAGVVPDTREIIAASEELQILRAVAATRVAALRAEEARLISASQSSKREYITSAALALDTALASIDRALASYSDAARLDGSLRSSAMRDAEREIARATIAVRSANATTAHIASLDTRGDAEMSLLALEIREPGAASDSDGVRTLIVTADLASRLDSLADYADSLTQNDILSIAIDVSREMVRMEAALTGYRSVGDETQAARITNALSYMQSASQKMRSVASTLEMLAARDLADEPRLIAREFEARRAEIGDRLRYAADDIRNARRALAGEEPRYAWETAGFTRGGTGGTGGTGDGGGSRIERFKRGGFVAALITALFTSYLATDRWLDTPSAPSDSDASSDDGKPARGRPVKLVPVPLDPPREVERRDPETRTPSPEPTEAQRDAQRKLTPEERAAIERRGAEIARILRDNPGAPIPPEDKDWFILRDETGKPFAIVHEPTGIVSRFDAVPADAPADTARPAETPDDTRAETPPATRRDTPGKEAPVTTGPGARTPGVSGEPRAATQSGDPSSAAGSGGLGAFGNIFSILNQLLKLAGITPQTGGEPALKPPAEQTSLSLIPEKLIAQKGEKVKLEWKSTGTSGCTVYAQQGPLATGGATGVVQTPALEQTSVFRLVCIKNGGGVMEVFVSIQVPGTPSPTQKDLSAPSLQSAGSNPSVLTPIYNTCNPEDPRMNLRTYLACLGYPYDPAWDQSR